MNIKEEIGLRILQARKAQGLTRKALAELTDDLKQSRINNWERGERTPGPEEIKQLAKALKISPAFLMCLTDEKEPKKIPGLGKVVPLLDNFEACDPKTKLETTNQNEITFTPLGYELSKNIGKHAFSLKIKDDSMEPELKQGDILIIDPDKKPNPGSFVVAKIEGNPEVVIRIYKQLSVSENHQAFELLALNSHWATIKNSVKCTLIGSVCGLMRNLS